ncbi:hypothetical protein BJX68DRAFT_225130 [Aspergillus pseudodeflectus]|uniref:Uncharacterized protein n=1 Tax=Aspergillus pseudodeflectus TaxID=176178 RepID=A0ABR4L8D3_9EURO
MNARIQQSTCRVRLPLYTLRSDSTEGNAGMPGRILRHYPRRPSRVTPHYLNSTTAAELVLCFLSISIWTPVQRMGRLKTGWREEAASFSG